MIFSFASGHNVAVTTSDIPQDRKQHPHVHTLTTAWLPTAQVWRVLPEPSTEEVRHGAYGHGDVGQTGPSRADGRPVGAHGQRLWDWIDHQPPAQSKILPFRAPPTNSVSANRIDAGVQLLNNDPLVCEAFRTMNLVVARSQRQRGALHDSVAPHGIEPPRWRFFQLAFVLRNLPGLTTPDSEHGRQDRAAVELLFFPTGGGTLEACLGLAAFTLVHRRLSHLGITSAGVTVLMGYTHLTAAHHGSTGASRHRDLRPGVGTPGAGQSGP